ncbi:cytosine deaminase [Roseibium sp.]|uniref:cytosine deaminase n=1 Tax=Roseibium sp. TaxID=1936156 RepID=UPI003A9757D2
MANVLPSDLRGDFVLRRASVSGCLLPPDFRAVAQGDLAIVDIEVVSGAIRALRPSDAVEVAGDAVFDMDYGMVLPTLVDMHTHLDKGHIWQRNANPDGTFGGALAAVAEDRLAHWNAEDVRTRMEFGLRCAYAQGTSVVRTHIDSLPPQETISWPVFEEVRAEWSGRVELQGACLFGIDRLIDEPGFLDVIADRVKQAGGVLGAVTYMVPGLDGLLDRIFEAAMSRGLDLDFHVDETNDPAAKSLRHIAEAALRAKFDGKIVCGHCCSLAQQDMEEADRTLDLVASAGIGVVSLPMCNMYLQDRSPGRTPRWRGVTLLHEMKARGIPVAVASDNTRDPFYAYGDLDLIEVYAQATRILHLDHPVGDWISAVSTAPAGMLGVPAPSISDGAAANLILFRGRNWSELLSRPSAPRDVIRDGFTLNDRVPDYRELDHLMTGNGAVL